MYNLPVDQTNIFLKPSDFADYELLDSGNGRKLERFGKYILNRIEAQAIWKPLHNEELWHKADAVFQRENEQRGRWKKRTPMPDSWNISYKKLIFNLKLTSFGHVGIFPEQAEQWDWIAEKVPALKRTDKIASQNENIHNDEGKNNETIQQFNNCNILSLFSYTGAATLAAAAAGAHVVHVDASKPAITWARENQKLSGLEQKPIRWIVDDALKFVKREVRRSSRYQGIIMDPPKFGRGPQGEVWKFEESILELLDYCRQIITPNGFLLITAYAVSISPITLRNIIASYFKYKGNSEFGEIGMQESKSDRLLSAAIYARQ